MKRTETTVCVLAICAICVLVDPAARAGGDIPHPKTYKPGVADLKKAKAHYDDPRTLVGGEFDPKNILPPEMKEKVFFNVEEMEETWAETVGCRAPDVVGKIAPEIKPGKYTYEDLAKHPGLKELMIPGIYERIKPGEKPFAGNIPEFEVLPTRQYYWPLPLAEATLRNMGKTKLDEDGYIIEESWESGFPFPRPSGKMKAQQYVYNHRKSDLGGGNMDSISISFGVDRDLRVDTKSEGIIRGMRCKGRVLFEPYGWYDDLAVKRDESNLGMLFYLSPRDLYGTVLSTVNYNDSERQAQHIMYIPGLRRFRKLSSTDVQDPVLGADQIVDDAGFFNQKLSPNRYPYRYEVLEEREFLFPLDSDGTLTLDSKDGFVFRNLRMERRPMVVLQLTQLDPNYVYSKRIFYVDREVFAIGFVENYDQKGRLYRTNLLIPCFDAEMGNFWFVTATWRDHIDLHSSVGFFYNLPAVYDRKDLSMKAMVEMGK